MEEEELKQLVQNMINAGESEENIAIVIRKYSKPKNSKKKKDGESTSKNQKSASEQKVGSVDGVESSKKPKTMGLPNASEEAAPKVSEKPKTFRLPSMEELQDNGFTRPPSELSRQTANNTDNLYDLDGNGNLIDDKKTKSKAGSNFVTPLTSTAKATIASNNNAAKTIKTGDKLRLEGQVQKAGFDTPELTEDLYNFTSKDQKEILAEIDKKIEDNDLNLDHPYLYYSTYNKTDRPKDGFIEDNFDVEKLAGIGINPADFDGFLNKIKEINGSSYKAEYLDKEAKGLFEGEGRDFSGGYNIQLAKEIQKSRLLSLYMEDINSRDFAKRKLTQEKVNLGRNSADREEWTTQYTSFDNKKIGDYYEKEMPLLTQKLKERDAENLKIYEEYKKDNFSWVGQTFKSGFNGLLDRVNQLSSTMLDKLHFESLSQELKFVNEERQLARPNTRDVGYYLGNQVTYDGVDYAVTDDGQIIDQDKKMVATDLFMKSAHDEIIKRSKTGERVSGFSFQGSAVKMGGILGDMLVQIALQKGFGMLAGAKKAKMARDAFSNMFISREMGSAIIVQSAFGYSQGLENTYKAAVDAGIDENTAKVLAADAAQRMAYLYAVTTPMSPQIKAVQGIFGAEGKTLIIKAIAAYNKTGKKGFIEVLDSGIKKFAKGAVIFGEEGIKEVFQENTQQAGETYVVNAKTNQMAGQQLFKPTISVQEVINTSILSFGSSGIMSIPSNFSSFDKLNTLHTLSQDPTAFENNIKELVSKGVFTNDKADALRKDVKIYSNQSNKIPKNIDRDIAMDVMTDLQDIADLEAKKKGLDPAFHEEINAEIEAKRIGITDRVSFTGLSKKEIKSLKEQASDELVAEAKEQGKKEFLFDNKQITERANVIFAKQEKEAKAQAKEEAKAKAESSVKIPDDLKEEHTQELEKLNERISKAKANLEHEKSKGFLSRSKSDIKYYERTAKRLEYELKSLQENPVQYYKDLLVSEKGYYESRLEDNEDYRKTQIEQFGTDKFEVVYADAVQYFTDKIVKIEEANKPSEANAIPEVKVELTQVETEKVAEAETNNSKLDIDKLEVNDNFGDITIGIVDKDNQSVKAYEDANGEVIRFKTKEEAQAKLDEIQGKTKEVVQQTEELSSSEKESIQKAIDERDSISLGATGETGNFIRANTSVGSIKIDYTPQELAELNDINKKLPEVREGDSDINWKERHALELDLQKKVLKRFLDGNVKTVSTEPKTTNTEPTSVVSENQATPPTENAGTPLTAEQTEAKKRVDDFVAETITFPTTDKDFKEKLLNDPEAALNELIDFRKSQLEGASEAATKMHQNAIAKFEGLIADIKLANSTTNEKTSTNDTASNGDVSAGTDTNLPQGQNSGLQSSPDARNVESPTELESKETSVMVAPYYDTTIANITDAKALRESDGYKKHVIMLHEIAKGLGLKIINLEETIGGWVHENGKKITEISNRVHLDTNDLAKAEDFAALIGALTYEIQDTTYAVKYVEHGSASQTAIEMELKVADTQKALEIMKSLEIDFYEINDKNNTIKFLDFADGKDLEFNEKMSNLAKELKTNNLLNEKAKHRAIESREVDYKTRPTVLEGLRLRTDKRHGGEGFYNYIEKAIAKSKEFLAKKQAEEAEKAAAEVVEKTEQQQDLDFALSEIAKGVLDWDGDMNKLHVTRFGMTWLNIRKGQADLKNGKTNTAPAKKLIEAFKNAKAEGGYNKTKGQGVLAQTRLYLFGEEDTKPQLSEKAQKRLDFTTASIEEIQERLKKYLGGNPDLDPDNNLHKDGLSTAEIIDIVAKLAKIIAKGAIITIDHIEQAIKTLQADFKFNLDPQLVYDFIHPKTQLGQADKLEAFRDHIRGMINSGVFSEYLSGDTIKSVYMGELRNDQDIEVVVLDDAADHGLRTIAMAKDLFGEEYVEKTLDFLETANLEAGEKALVYVSLENEMNIRTEADPHNVGEMKLEDLVREKSQRHLRMSAIAINMGRLRFRLKYGYLSDGVTNQLYTKKQKSAKKTIQKLVEATADQINKEAELQEQEAEDVLSEEDYSFEIAKPKNPRNIKVLKAELKDVFAQGRADLLKAAKGGKGTYATIPFAAQLAAVAPTMIKAAKLLVEMGELTTKEIIETIYKEFKKGIADLTRKHVADTLREGTKKKRGVATPESKRKLYINRLLKDIAALDEQIKAKKKTVVVVQDNYSEDPEIKALRKLKKSKQEELAKADPEYGESRKLKADLEKAQRSLENWEKKIKDNDFTAAEKSAKPVNEQLQKLRNARDDARKRYQEKKAQYMQSLITPESIAEKKVKAKIEAIKKSIAALMDKLDNPNLNTNEGKNSLWTKEIGELKQVQAQLQKVLADRKKAARLEAKKAPLTAEEKLANAKEKVRNRIEALKEEISDKKATLKYTKKNTDAELQALEAEERQLKKLALQYLSDEDKALLDERAKERVVDKLTAEIAKIDEQIAKGQKSPVADKKAPLDSPEIAELKAKKKAKLAVLEAIDPTPKEFVKQALIEAGFGREITVTTKEGKVKKNILDWKKLAGAEGSVDKIRKYVEQALKDKGFSDFEMERMKTAFEDEYNNLRAGIIQKGINELENRNAFKNKVEQKSASRRLAELYNYGLFEKGADAYKRIMNRALGFSEFDQETFAELEDLARTMAATMRSGLSDLELSDPVTSLNKKIRRLTARAQYRAAPFYYKVGDIFSEFVNLAQRFMLSNLKQVIENPFSGYVQRVFSKIAYTFDGSDNKALYDQRRKISAARGKSINLDGGGSYGDTSSLLVHESKLENKLNEMTTSETAHGAISAYFGRFFLEAFDSVHKTMLTEKYFNHNLIKILTDPSNPNRMSKKEALNYITEKLTGQSFDNAMFKAREITDAVNQEAGKKMLNDNERAIMIFAQEIMKKALADGGVMTIEEITAAYKAAYKGAGNDLGHVANNPVSKWVGMYSASVSADLAQALQERNFPQALGFLLLQLLTRNVMNVFVGGGSNWITLQAQKAGILNIGGVAAVGFDYLNQRNLKVDLASEEGIKELEKTLYLSLKYKNAAARMVIGSVIGAIAVAALAASGGDDEIVKWLKKNSWAKPYFDKLAPEMVMMVVYYKSGNKDFSRYLEHVFNVKVDLFDNTKNAYKAVKDAVLEKEFGKTGKVIGDRFNAPAPYRVAKDITKVVRGIQGKKPIKEDYSTSTFLNGFFQGGLIEFAGFRPEGEPVQKGGGKYKKPEQPKAPKPPTAPRP